MTIAGTATAGAKIYNGRRLDAIATPGINSTEKTIFK
jgi:hypothetical protein